MKKTIKRSISIRFYIIVAVSGLVITFLFSTVHYYINYKNELKMLDDRIHFVETSYVPVISKSLYEINEEQIKLQLEGITKLQDVVSATVIDSSIPLQLEVSEADVEESVQILNFDLVQNQGSEDSVVLGKLIIGISYGTLYKRSYTEFINIILSNSLIVFSVALIIFLASEISITRPLSKLVSYTENIVISENATPILPPEKNTKTIDELTTIENSILSLQKRIAKFVFLKNESEEALQRAVKEKEVLLRELYHRTKNNMQVISSMLLIQRMNMKNQLVNSVFQDMETRIQSMSLVHQMLYETSNLSTVNLKDYVERLSKLLCSSFIRNNVKIMVDVEGVDILISIDTALPCGLVINELITNSLKHAFKDRNEGHIAVNLNYLDDLSIVIDYRDNGSGVNEGFDFRSQPSFGLQTIFNIVEKQLHGSINFINSNGLYTQIMFQESKLANRL